MANWRSQIQSSIDEMRDLRVNLLSNMGVAEPGAGGGEAPKSAIPEGTIAVGPGGKQLKMNARGKWEAL